MIVVSLTRSKLSYDMRNLIISIPLILFLLGGCTKGNNDSFDNQQQEGTVEDVSYFVKYAANGIPVRYDASYINPEGETVRLTNIAGENFERTIGPVPKGFKARFSIKAYGTTTSGAQIALRIEVKKGSDPFVVKAESSGTILYGATAEYTVE